MYAIYILIVGTLTVRPPYGGLHVTKNTARYRAWKETKSAEETWLLYGEEAADVGTCHT